MALLRGLLLAAALTPLCWVCTLAAVRRIRQTGLVGPGLDEVFDQAERYAWAAGVFLALLLANGLGRVTGYAWIAGALLAAGGVGLWLALKK
jgi:hypothetical protein